MDRGRGDTTVGLRLALDSMVAGALALLAPWLYVGAFDAPATASLAVVTLVLAALVRLAGQGAALADRVPAVSAPTGDGAPPVPAGRVTDPTHHPLRPRAPGQA